MSREQGLSMRAFARELGMSLVAARKYAHAESPPTKKLGARERAKGEVMAESLIAADQHRVTYSLLTQGDRIAGQQHLHDTTMPYNW